MATIIPTITAENAHTYREQIQRVQSFAKHLHIDLMDGIFTENKSISIAQVWWPEDTTVDIHVMFQDPQNILNELIKLKPRLVTVHAESDCSVSSFAQQLNENSIQCGLAVFPETTISSVAHNLNDVQQLLIFSGNLGHQGGSHADLSLLTKITQAKEINPSLEIAWDGGVNAKNCEALAAAGVTFLNVGGYIQSAQNPALAYEDMKALVP